MAKEYKEFYEVEINIEVDYEPNFLDSIKFDLAHKFDIPIEKVSVKCKRGVNWNQVFDFIDNYSKE